MFSRAITSLSPWTDNGMFENISGQGFRDGYGDHDYSMTAVARALLARRLPEDEQFKIRISNLPSDDAILTDFGKVLDGVAYNVSDGSIENIDGLRNIVIVSQLRDATDELYESVKKAVEEQVIPNHEGWSIHGKSEAFLNKEIKARVLINKENRSAFVLTKRLSMAHWHLLGSMFPTYVQGLFDAEALADDEKQVLKSLALHGSNTFVTEIAKLEERYDIRGKKIQALIGGFEIREREAQVAVVDNEITQISSQMDDLMRRYEELVRKIDDANVRRAGLKYFKEQSEDDDQLVKFFQANKCLDVVEVYGSRISFVVRTYYENFDQDEYERFRENERWYEEIVNRAGVFSEVENCRKIMDAMFITQQIKLRMCAVYHLDIRGSVSTTIDYAYPANCNDYIPNYHLDHHHCLGNYERVITDYLRNGDTIGAINACIASAKSVNIAESGATFNPMMNKIFRSNKNCFELPDGTCVTPAKALEWLNKQEGGSQNETDSAD